MSMTNQSDKKGKLRRGIATIAVVVVLSTGTAACTPEEFEAAFNDISTSFESGYDFETTLSGYLVRASMALSYLTSGLGLGPGFP